MESEPTWLAVVALALRDDTGRLLLQRRPAEKHHGGLWEFPGGKVERAENPRFALVREIAEELGLAISASDLTPALVADEQGARPVVLFLYTCAAWQGEVLPSEGQQWGWFTREAARALDLAPMDRDLLERLPE